jgi:hypothetical protein
VIRGTRESVGALPSRETWSRAVRYMELSEPSQARRQGLKPQDTWQRRSPPKQGGRVQSRGTRDSVEALPSREAGSEAAGHMAVRLTPCLGLEACMRGYPVYRVPTLVIAIMDSDPCPRPFRVVWQTFPYLINVVDPRSNVRLFLIMDKKFQLSLCKL